MQIIDLHPLIVCIEQYLFILALTINYISACNQIYEPLEITPTVYL